METKLDTATLEDQWYVTQHDQMTLVYDLWAEHGQLAFVLTNNGDNPVYVDWNRSHFIFNGVSYEYWYDEEQNRSFYSTTSSSSGTHFAVAFLNALQGYPTYPTTYRKNTESGSIKFKPKRIIEIPPHSAIYVSKFSITKDLYHTCDFHMKYKSANKSESVSFTKQTSPVTFRNYLTYSSTPEFTSTSMIDDGFYVANIHNMNLKVFNGKQESADYCTVDGQKASRTYFTMPYKKADSFFLKRLK